MTKHEVGCLVSHNIGPGQVYLVLMRRLLDQSRTRFAAQARALKREAPFFRVMRAVIERIRRSSLLAKEV